MRTLRRYAGTFRASLLTKTLCCDTHTQTRARAQHAMQAAAREARRDEEHTHNDAPETSGVFRFINTSLGAYMCDSICVCVCACVRGREIERERGGESPVGEQHCARDDTRAEPHAYGMWVH